jgi:hypothetical protein
LAAAVVIAGAGCSTQGLVLEQPDQLKDLKPPALSTTKLPAKLSWNARPLAPDEHYVVFVDQQPIAPGDSIRSVADDTCKATPGCPNKAYLNQHFIFSTHTNSVEIPFFPIDGPFPVNDLYGLHQATIVILNRDRIRVGEEYWTTSFYTSSAT